MSVINHRLARANNEPIPGYDAGLEKSFIALFDANSLYGWAMSRCLPTKNFKFMNETDIHLINENDVMNLKDKGDIGYVFEVDLLYPDELHDTHSAYPLAPESVFVSESMLSPFCLSFDRKHIDCKKLIPNLNSKVK